MKGLMLVSDDQELIVAQQIVDEKRVSITVKLDKIANITDEELSEHQAILGYGNYINRELLARFAQHGVKYYVTRSTGYNHIDLKAAREFGIRIANVPAYSPNAIAELALALALDLNRKVSEQANDIANKRFNRPEKLFKEIRDCTVGILGLGSIGSKTAHYFHALGANVIGYNRSINTDNEKILTYLDIDEVIKQSDILLIHLPYIQDENYHLINKELLKDAKKELIIINTARGELVNLRDIVELIEKDLLGGYGADVFEFESEYIGKDKPIIKHDVIEKAIKLYPKILLTPHIGAATERALYSLVDISIDNFIEFDMHNECINEIK